MDRNISIAHICFLDIVGYSSFGMSEQLAYYRMLQDIVDKAKSSLLNVHADTVVIPTGDGFALCFWDDPEHALLFALEVNCLLNENNEQLPSASNFKIRTGINSGVVMPVMDIRGKLNVAGAGLNNAQRIMSLCAPNQILASKGFSEIFAEINEELYWPLFSYMGKYEVKHGASVEVYNIAGMWKGIFIGNSQPIGNSVDASITAQKQTQKYAFIIMSFSPDDPFLVDVHHCIKSICQSKNVLAERVDEIEYGGKITDRIVDCIKRSEVIVADLSHERPNVYYEIGLAHGQGIEVILIARQGTTLHFDLAGFNVIFYRNITELTARLEKRIAAVLGK